jgi:hypothetical protein
MPTSSDQDRSQPQAGGRGHFVRKFYQLLTNRRMSERVPVSGAIFITCLGRAIVTTYECSVVDMSRGGLAAHCPEPLESGAFVQLTSDEHGTKRLARVRYCISTDGVHRVGMEFVAGTGASEAP